MGALSITICVVLFLSSHVVSSQITSKCPHNWFDCGDGECISRFWHCDGSFDCANRADEMDCDGSVTHFNHVRDCPHGHFLCSHGDICIPDKWKCDGRADCPGGDDEVNCTSSDCLGFACANKECIPESWRCDDSEDCLDGSDELNCPVSKASKSHCIMENGFFLCTSGECIHLEHVCDGKIDCRNRDDEGSHCLSSNSSRFRLDKNCSRTDCSHACRVLPSGQDQCVCEHGFYLHQDNRTCHDIDECSIDGWCSHTCVNSIGSFTCSCNQGYQLQTNNRTCMVPPAAEPLLLYSDGDSIRAMYLKHTGNGTRHTSSRYFEVHRGVGRVVGISMDPKTSKIFWADLGSTHSAIYSTDMTESHTSTRKSIVSSGLVTPEDLAYDWVANNIYITDSGLDKIIVCKDDGSVCSVLFEGLDNPRSLSLDPANGRIYWSEWGPSRAGVYRSGMDGSLVAVIANTSISWPNGLTLDPSTSRVYWADAKANRLEFYDLKSGKRHTMLDASVFHPWSLAVFEDNLYWSDWITFSISTCDKFSGRNQTLLSREAGKYISGLHVYHPSLYVKSIGNPCWGEPCSHICLLAPSHSYKCACPSHMILSEDNKTCEAVTTAFVLVSQKHSIRKIYPQSIGRDVVEEVELPRKFTITDFSFDPDSHTLYIFECEKNCSIFACNIKEQKCESIAQPLAKSVQGLTFDRMTKNLLWVDSILGHLEVLSTVTRTWRTLIDTTLERPTDLALNYRDRLVYIANLGSEPFILQANMDGTQPVKLIGGSQVGLPVSVFYSSLQHRLYWADAKLGTIESVGLSNEAIVNANKRDVVTKNHMHIMSLGLVNNSVFFTDMDSPYVYHQQSLGHMHTTIPMPAEHEKSVKKIQVIDMDLNAVNECALKNGACSHICLLTQSGANCTCHTTHFVDPHNSTNCLHNLQCKPNELQCVDRVNCYDKLFACDGHKDCLDGSDETDCSAECKGFSCKNGKCIIDSWRCDQTDDCGDRSDEQDCTPITCKADKFSCGDGQCIPASWRCDGNKQCHSEIDEKDCDIHSCETDDSRFKCEPGVCIPKSWLCDGESDCNDASDENNCTNTCDSNQHRCHSEYQCIDKSLLCDGHNDCSDASDEANCLDILHCPDGSSVCPEDRHCIYPSDICDGHKDCDDGYDEKNCSRATCSTHETMCANSSKCIALLWVCDGQNDCEDWSDENRPQCVHKENDASTTTARPCRDGSFPCDSGECIHYDLVCNDHRDCIDGSDEGSSCRAACSSSNCSQTCRPTPNGGQCACNEGYTLDTDGKTCMDIDECTEYGYCSHKCLNTPSSFRCSCHEGFSLAADMRRCKANPVNITGQPEDAHLIYIVQERIMSLNLHRHSRHEFLRLTNVDIDSFDFDFESRTIFWIEPKKGTLNSRQFNFTDDVVEVGPETILHKDLVEPSHLNYDWLGKNIYFFSAGQIVACSHTASYCYNVMSTRYNRISSMALAPNYGFIFFAVRPEAVKTYGAIVRVDMNGLNKFNIIANDARFRSPHALTVDLVLKEIYWVDTELNQIASSDFLGHRKVLSYAVARPYALAIFEDSLYVSNWGTDVLTKWSKFNKGRSRAIVHRNNIMTRLARVYHQVSQPKASNNSCANSTCDSSTLCLLNPYGFSCSCPPGHSLSKNNVCVEDANVVDFASIATINTEEPRRIDCDTDDDCLNDGICDANGRCSCKPGYVGIKCENIGYGPISAPSPSTNGVVGLSMTIITILAAVFAIAGLVNYYFKGPITVTRTMAASSATNPFRNISIAFRNPIFHRRLNEESLLNDDQEAADHQPAKKRFDFSYMHSYNEPCISRSVSTASAFSNCSDELDTSPAHDQFASAPGSYGPLATETIVPSSTNLECTSDDALLLP